MLTLSMMMANTEVEVEERNLVVDGHGLLRSVAPQVAIFTRGVPYIDLTQIFRRLF